MKQCIALNCDEELSGGQRLYCSGRCKQTVKYAHQTGRQCRACHKPIKKPVAKLGGYEGLCDRVRCKRERGDA